MLYHILSYEKSNLLKIDNIGFSEDPKICRFGPGKRDLYLIHYVVSGSGVFNGNTVKSGQGFLITPQNYEHYYPNGNNSWKLLWVTSRDKVIEEIFNSYNANPQTNIFNYSYQTQAENLTEYIRANHNKIFSATEILEIFLSLFNNQKKVLNNPPENAADLYYNFALNHINSNIFRPVRVEELTDILGVSQPYLYKIFMSKSGVSPKQTINNIKFNKAKELLKNTSINISDVAYSVGFDDPFMFSKFFKQKSGMSPTEFRNTANLKFKLTK